MLATLAVLAGSLGTIYFAWSTLLDIEHSLPVKINQQEGDVVQLMQDVSDLAWQVRLARNDPSPPRIRDVLEQVDKAETSLQIIRSNYNFDNLIGASAMHAIANPALTDIRLWLTEGIYELAPDSPAVLILVEARVTDTVDTMRPMFAMAKNNAFDALLRQSRRIERFRGSIMIVLVVLAGITMAVIAQIYRRRAIIANLRKSEEELRRSEALYRQAELMGRLGHYEWDWTNGRMAACSEQFARIHEMTIDETLRCFSDRKSLLDTIYPDDLEYFEQNFRESKQRLEGRDTEFRIVTRSGKVRHIHLLSELVFDGQGKPIKSFGTVQDITEWKLAEEELAHQATHDALTGLINRREFERRLGRVLDTARERRDEHALCYLDLDQFKVVNDTCGHMAGDELLRQIGQLLLVSVRKRDTLARLGGDEFGVLMEHCSLPQARRVADKLRKAVEGFNFAWEARAFRIGVSIGLVPVTETSENVASILSAADSACYVAKDEGRNRVHVYHIDDTVVARRQGEMQWVARIDHALEDQRLQLWSQPIVPVVADSGEGEKFELLLRLEDERGGIIPAGDFLPAVERYGLSNKLDRWVIGAAFGWLSRNPKLLDRLGLCFINLSGNSLSDPEFLAFAITQMDQFRIPPRKICFEVAETTAIANLSRMMTFMEALRSRGCRFALDEFGSGLSSFAYLRTLPVDYLKIDGAFVKDIVDDEVDLALVRSINDLGRVMGKLTIAEFAENAAILEKLREIGVDYAQGYGVARPAQIDETIPFGATHLRVV